MRGSARPARLPVGRERAATPAPPWRLVGDDGDGTSRARRPPTPAERRAGAPGAAAPGHGGGLGPMGTTPQPELLPWNSPWGPLAPREVTTPLPSCGGVRRG